MMRIFYPKAIKRLIKRYKKVSPSGTVKYNPDRFASIELYTNDNVLVGVLESCEFLEKIEQLEKKNK